MSPPYISQEFEAETGPPPAKRAARDPTLSGRARTAKHSRGKKKDGPQQPENPLNRDAYDAKRQQQQPHDGVKNEREQRQRPAQNQQDAPQ
jgi:hypothetical protein